MANFPPFIEIVNISLLICYHWLYTTCSD